MSSEDGVYNYLITLVGCCLPSKPTDVIETSNKSKSSVTQATSKLYERKIEVIDSISHQSEPLPAANTQEIESQPQVELTKVTTAATTETTSVVSISSDNDSANAVIPSAEAPAPPSSTSSTSTSKSRIVGIVRDSMQINPIDHTTSEHDSVPASSSSRQNQSQSQLQKGSNGFSLAHPIAGSDNVMRYTCTSMVKPKGHRVRIEPNFGSKAVHLIVPPGPLLLSRVIVAEGCEWGKVHPSMFPAGFKACDTVSDGWCLLNDARNPTLPVTYWRPTH